MPTEQIDDAHVYPEDIGTDAPESYTQPGGAGRLGGLVRHEVLSQYVETGLEFYPDYGALTLDITEGLAFLLVDSNVQVKDENGEYSAAWRSGMTIAVDLPEVTDVPLSSGSENHVFLVVNMSIGDGARIEVNTTDEQPDSPYLKLGTVHPGSEEYEHMNRETGFAETDYVDALVGDHTTATVAHGSNGDIAGVDDLFTDDDARSAVDGSDVSVSHAEEADTAHLWDGLEVVFDDEEPETNKYVRLELEE